MFIPNIMWMFYGNYVDPADLSARVILFTGFVTVLFPILVLNLMIDRMVVNRVRALNRATRKVMAGDFDVSLYVDTDDEISDLMISFNKMAEELKSNEYLSKEFVRNFSHELKTPLSAIKGYSDLINEGKATKEDILEYTRIISSESERLSNLSRNMLQISLLDSQNIISKSDEYNVAEQIRNVIQLMQIDWESKNVLLDLNLKDVTIVSNKELTYQVWTNLISNAIKFSEENETIKMSLLDEEKNIKFMIANEGEIPKDDQERVFDLFFVSDKSRSVQSNGVGLTLTKKIILKLGGEINFESKNNQTIFYLTLPKK
jgi:signal transduction histidine kinase